MSETKFVGGCHCGAIRFQVELDLAQVTHRCNCTLCTKLAPTNAIVKPTAFELLVGKDIVVDYQRGGDNPSHFPFCPRCGVHAYAHGNIPELGGEYYSINVNCLDGVDPSIVSVQYWDGRHDNWNAGPRATPWPTLP
jgi:hypothetical protein